MNEKIEPRKRTVYMKINKSEKIYLPCDIAHNIRELIEENTIEGFNYNYEIGDLE